MKKLPKVVGKDITLNQFIRMNFRMPTDVRDKLKKKYHATLMEKLWDTSPEFRNEVLEVIADTPHRHDGVYAPTGIHES